jgi:heme exporter protein A
LVDHDAKYLRSGKSGLTVEGVSVERGGRTVLSELSLTVAAGEAILLLGANGAGKTTLLKAIAGLLPPAAGNIELSVGDRELPLAERAHYVGHANGVRASLSVAENAIFWAQFLGNGTQTVQPALERFGLDALASVPAGYLSAGQRRRLGLVRLLLAERPLWLLDEPTTSLDAKSTATLTQVVDAHIAGGGLAVIATHLPIKLSRSRQITLAPNTRAA